MKAIDSADEGWKITILLRLSPLMPYALINYLLSSTQLTFWTYTWCTAVGVLPPTALYVYLGTTAASLSDILGSAFSDTDDDDTPSPAVPLSPDTPIAPTAAPSAMDTTQLWVVGIGVVVTVVVAVLVTVFTSKAIKRASRIVPGGVEDAIADEMLEGSSATDDDNMMSLDRIEDDEENSVQMKDMSSMPRLRHSGNTPLDLDDDREGSILSLDTRAGSRSILGLSRTDIPSTDDSDIDEDILSRSSANSSTPFNHAHSPVLPRISGSDPYSSV